MGEIRVKVKLTNSMDEMLARRGKISFGEVRWTEVDAVVDTGAIRCVVPPQIVQELGLEIRGQRVAEYAYGRKDSVGVTEPLVVECLRRDTMEEALVLVMKFSSVRPSWKNLIYLRSAPISD